VRLLVATTNRGKLVEIREILSGLPVEVDSLDEYPGVEEAEEDGATFAENARAKATHYSRYTGQLAVADDSGLEIDALGGAPGVKSSRFNGTSYPEKFTAINRSLDAKGADGSTARFVCALAVANDRRVVFEATGVIEGQLAREPKGTGGFGFDPIFFYPPYGRTFAEMSPAEKASVSHRGQAFRALRTYLKTQLRL
jgi:XTP/dITP diphosphohydrolase